MNKPAGLYIHVPFCRRKCAYCDFYSLTDCSELIDEYCRAVIRNIKAAGGKYDTVYFGGGTPSLLSPHQIDEILSSADIEKGAEISIECNPDSVSCDKLREYRSAGLNRISIGVQSFSDIELSAVGRLHNGRQAESAIISAQKSGFENISADLMLGLPFQSIASVGENIRRLAKLEVRHISAYMLKIEESTPLFKSPELLNSCPAEDAQADFYEYAVRTLQDNGFLQYEISNFAKKGFECRHNLKYWLCEDYMGIGPSAHSLINNIRYAVPKSLRLFIDRSVQKTVITDEKPCTAEERLMLALRLAEGFDINTAGEKAQILKNKAKVLEKHGFLKISNNRIMLTSKGFLVSNEIICRLSEAFY